MTRYGFSQRQRARREARTLSSPHNPSEVPSPWWAPLVKLRRLKLRLFHRFRPRCSNSNSSNEPNVLNDSVGAGEAGGQERVPEDDQNLQSIISSTQNNGLMSNGNNNTFHRSASPASPMLNDLFKAENTENTTNADIVLAGDDTAKSRIDRNGRKSSKTITKNWVTRFKDSQKPINPHRRRKYNMKSPTSSVRERVLRRLEYKNLGIELSYADVRRADWKPRDHMAVDLRIADTRKPKPGYSNLRYCLTYLKQVQDTVSGLGSSWARDHKQWFARWGTVRAAALCLGV